jgi:hypothetical protein
MPVPRNRPLTFHSCRAYTGVMTRTRTLEAGQPDILDLWLDAPTDQDWGDWLELTFDPDCDPLPY